MNYSHLGVYMYIGLQLALIRTVLNVILIHVYIIQCVIIDTFIPSRPSGVLRSEDILGPFTLVIGKTTSLYFRWKCSTSASVTSREEQSSLMERPRNST